MRTHPDAPGTMGAGAARRSRAGAALALALSLSLPPGAATHAARPEARPAAAGDAAIDHDALRRARIGTLLPEAMRAHGIDLWITFAREHAEDPLLPLLGVNHIVARGAFVFRLDADGTLHRTAIAASYDVDAPQRSGIYDEIIAYRQEGVRPHLADLIARADPKVIAVNTSRDLTIADGLTAGMEAYLRETVGRKYAKRFVSSEKLVASLLGRKLPEEIEAIRKASLATQQILAEALTADVVRPGVTTENMLNDWMVRRAEELGCGVAFSSVVTGPTRGHSDPSDRVIEPGDVIRIDWGATWQGYASDIQRTAYVLKPGETRAPEWLERIWRDTLAANRAATAACRPGARGVDVDTAGRKVIVEAGHDEYPHGSGHPIGLLVHDVGPKLSPDWRERYGDPVFFLIEPDQVFAIEPMVYTTPPELGYEINIALEENVVVGPEGAAYIGTPQTDLILIPSGAPR